MSFDIKDRAKKFANRIIQLIRKFPKDMAGQIIGKQILRSGTSIGANLEEADAASSRKDFLHKVNISYKEAKETRYWLELIIESAILNNQENIEETKKLKKEAIELSKILFSIIYPKKDKSTSKRDLINNKE